MAKIKHTKNEMKAQRDALQRFERFLPMLQLKKQQLQAEIQIIESSRTEKQAQLEALQSSMSSWVKLLSEPVELETLLSLREIITEDGNIAGVLIPVLKDVLTNKKEYDLFSTPLWVDDAITSLEEQITLRAETDILTQQLDCVSEELRVTSQRVNLFEKVKIPECKENIRVINIFLGDEQTAAVARGKIAKRRTVDFAEKDEAA
jgi:V/A-type H+-transporting ATPase subunit D